MDAVEQPILRRDDVAGIVRLTLNRPQARNALSLALLRRLHDELTTIGADAAARVVVIAGAGPAFCAGHDLKELRATPGRERYEELFTLCSAVMTAIVRLPQPVIARVHGMATAAGCQLVASCDLAVASSDARFATPGVNIGLFCSTPMVALARNVGRKQAVEMLLTGEPIDAETARGFGLVNRVVAPEGLDAEVDGMARQIAGKSAQVLKIGKEAFHRQLELGLDDAYAYASRVMTENMLARDAEEGIDAFLEKRAPAWGD